MCSRVLAIHLTVFLLFGTALNCSAEVPPLHIAAEKKECKKEGCGDRGAVFFVHGLFGSNKSWKNDKTGIEWPKLIAQDSELRTLDIYTIEYKSSMLENSPSVSEITKHMYDAMLPHYRSRYGMIIFIGHSLGGNLVRAHITQLKAQFGHQALNNIRMIVLLGSPTAGAPLATGTGLLLPNPQIGSLVEIKRNDYLGLLDSTFVRASGKHRDFGCPSLRVFSAYETRNTYGRQVVNKESATKGAYACKGFELDHMELSRPAGINSDLYMSVKKLIALCVAGNEDVCPRPPRPRGLQYVCSDEKRVDFFQPSRLEEKCERAWP
jgi:pimeloyl-ACP methyl ester carboxylesterase